MASGSVAPIATSKGPGIDIAPLYFTYPAAETPIGVVVYKDGKAAATGLAELILAAGQEALSAKGTFSIALSGGSLIDTFYRALEQLSSDFDFSKW